MPPTSWQGGVTAITNVALDHMECLGPTVEAIARRRRRSSSAAISARHRSDRAGRSTSSAAAPHGSTCRSDAFAPLELVGHRSWWNARPRCPSDGEIAVGLLGRIRRRMRRSLGHPRRAARRRHRHGQLTSSALAAFAAAKWPGRMELISRAGQPTVLLDGAHNPHGVGSPRRVARGTAAAGDPGGPVTVLIGGRWPITTSRACSSHSSRHCRPPRSSPRACPSRPTRCRRLGSPPTGARARARSRIPTRPSTLRCATRRSAGGPLVVCGSLYLVGHVRAQLLGSLEPAH